MEQNNAFQSQISAVFRHFPVSRTFRFLRYGTIRKMLSFEPKVMIANRLLTGLGILD